MERYKTRDGIVLTRVCGEWMLVAASALRDQCPFVTVVNESSAFLWKRLQSGADVEELERAVREEYEIEEPETVRSVIEAFLQQMLEMNYLITVAPDEAGIVTGKTDA